jgi:hypothetical protein
LTRLAPSRRNRIRDAGEAESPDTAVNGGRL